jgi:hypothetical protein
MRNIIDLKNRFMHYLTSNADDTTEWYVKGEFEIFYEGRRVQKARQVRKDSLILSVEDIHDMYEDIEIFDDDTYHLDKINVYKQIEW